jgi:hypothetical protein
MVSENQSAATTERQRFPKKAEQIGEDPARWLDRDLLKRTCVRQQADQTASRQQVRLIEDTDTSTPAKLLRARIRGIDKLSVLARWYEVENQLDRGPRDQVIALLDERKRDLKELGERPDRLPAGPWPDCDCCDDDGLTPEDLREQERVETTGRSVGVSDAVDTSKTSAQTEEASLEQFAGGEA